MSSTPQFNGEQLAAARSERWHQGADALLTLEAAREWVNELGLVLFAPHAHQLPMPAPSLVEATLGRVASAPTATETETARGLLARLVAEGAALPLNLLGGPGDTPDFVVSAPVFSYVFTLLGDKSWKQPPATSGAAKVSPLALKVYEVLAQGRAMTAAELVSELGRELTENAIARALSELWAQMRVIPLLQQDGSATMWELTSRRFTKQMKAGANAGQPTALSALISLYLTQAYAATEDEIETFLSPLAPRSKVRDVLHALRAGRQLEDAVLEGKTLLYVPGSLPEFPEIAKPEAAEEAASSAVAATTEAPAGERIRRFDRTREPRGERPERGFRGERERPAKPFREKPGGARREGKSFGERERRPFQRERPSGERPAFNRPWDEDRKPRPRREEGQRSEGERPYRERTERPSREKREFRPGPRRAEGGERPKRPYSPRPQGERPFRPRAEGDRPFRPRREGGGEGAGTRPSKPFSPRPEGERPFRARPEGGDRPFRPRREAGGEGAGTRPSKPFRERTGGERPYRPRPEGGERPFRPRREGGSEGAGARSAKPFRPRTKGERPFRPRPEGAGEERERRPAGAKFGGKPGFAGKRKFGEKSFGDKKKFGDKKFGGKPKFGSKSKFGGKPGPKGGKPKGKGSPKRKAEE